MKYTLLFGLLMITTIIITSEKEEISPVRIEVMYNTDATKNVNQALKELEQLTFDSNDPLKKIKANIPLYATQKEKNLSDLKTLVNRTEQMYEALSQLMKSYEKGKKTIDQLIPSIENLQKSLNTITDQVLLLRSEIQTMDTSPQSKVASIDPRISNDSTQTLLESFTTKFNTMQESIEKQNDISNKTMQSWMKQTQFFTTLSVAILSLTASFWVWWHAHRT